MINKNNITKIIDQVKINIKIDKFLEKRNIYPIRQYGDKRIYNCPIHKKDNTPSFYVYSKSSGDDFYCYGCKKGGSVISLKSYLDDEKYGKSLINFCDDLKISYNSSLKLEDIIDEYDGRLEENILDIDQLYEQVLIKISFSIKVSNINFETCLSLLSRLQKTYEQRDEIGIRNMLDGKF